MHRKTHPLLWTSCFSLATLIGFAMVGGMSRQGHASPLSDSHELTAGAVAIDVTPLEFPVIVNGGMTQRTAEQVIDRLHARCLVVGDGEQRVAWVVVDSCMMPRDLLDEAKTMASRATGIPMSAIMISATHTHSAPAAMGCLGSERDDRYAAFLPGQIAKGIIEADARRVPARVGWGVGQDPGNLFCRRWLMKPGTAPTNRFGGTQNDRAQMNPGVDNPNKIRQLGPVDPDVTVLAFQALTGEPIALYANYSTHYAGAPAISADYFGEFARLLETSVAKQWPEADFVAMLSNGTSGDANCLDFTDSSRQFDRFTVAQSVADVAWQVFQDIEFRQDCPIAFEERLLTLSVRLPDPEELRLAREVVAKLEGRLPRTIDEVYAREAVLLADGPPTRELKIQAFAIGDFGVATMPNEVFGETGLAIKQASPFATTMNVELANGAEGYIPPEDQHPLGGYTCWRARTSCLEVTAEAQIRATAIAALHAVNQKLKQRD